MKKLGKSFREDLIARVQSNAARRGKLSLLLQKHPDLSAPPYVPYLKFCLSIFAYAYVRIMSSGHQLKIETGRLLHVAPEECLCQMCDAINDKNHALFHCSKYGSYRQKCMEIIFQYPTSNERTLQYSYLQILNIEGYSASDLRAPTAVGNFAYKGLKLAEKEYMRCDA